MSDTTSSPAKPVPALPSAPPPTPEQRYARAHADALERVRHTMERCDRCPQPSKSEWLNAAIGLNLRFCGHCTHLHAPALPDKGFEDITQKKDDDQ